VRVNFDDLTGTDQTRFARALGAAVEQHQALARLIHGCPKLLDEARERLEERRESGRWDGEVAESLPSPWVDADGDADGRWACILQLEPREISLWMLVFFDDIEMNADTPFTLNSGVIEAEVKRMLRGRERGTGPHANTRPESNLARLRVERGLTQEAMVLRTGLPTTTYWRLERKRISNPAVGYLAVCASALQVELIDLLEPEYLSWRPRSSSPLTEGS
jgi:hypothetical protein